MNKSNTAEQSFRPNGRGDSSEPLPPPPPLADEVDQFVAHVTAGVKAWVDAGKLLLAMQRKDKNVFNKIIARCEWLTVDTLMTFTRIGRMELRPEVLLLNAPVSAKLMRLGYSQQSKLLDTRVPVATDIGQDGRALVQQKKITELTRADLDTLIDGSKLRTVTEQEQELRKRQNQRVKETVEPLIKPPVDGKKLLFLGNYRIIMRFGKPELVKCADLAAGAQRILLSKDLGGDFAALLELTKWSDA